MQVLIIDDEADARSVLTKIIERAGFGVTAVDNGLAALGEILQHRFSAIVCDIKMPFLEGRRFYDELASQRPDMADRVVFVTGHSSDQEVRELKARTGRPTLRKPVQVNELVDAVRSISNQEK